MAGRAIVGADDHVKDVAQAELVDGTARFGADPFGVNAAVNTLRDEQTQSAAEMKMGDGVAFGIPPTLDIAHAAGELRVFGPFQIDAEGLFAEADLHVPLGGEAVGEKLFFDKETNVIADVDAALITAEAEQRGGIGGGEWSGLRGG